MLEFDLAPAIPQERFPTLRPHHQHNVPRHREWRWVRRVNQLRSIVSARDVVNVDSGDLSVGFPRSVHSRIPTSFRRGYYSPQARQVAAGGLGYVYLNIWDEFHGGGGGGLNAKLNEGW